MTSLLSLQAKIAELQQQAAQIKSKEFSSTVADILAKMSAFGITVADLKAAQGKSKSVRGGRSKSVAGKASTKKQTSKLAGQKVAPKYRNEAGQTWTGRGVAPKWLSDAVASGRSKEDFLINKA